MESELHRMLREAGLSPDVIAAITTHVDEYTEGQVAMLKSANDGWQRRCNEVDVALAEYRAWCDAEGVTEHRAIAKIKDRA